MTDLDGGFPGFSGGYKDAKRRHMSKYEAAAARGDIWEMAYLEWYIHSWWPPGGHNEYMKAQRIIARAARKISVSST